MNWTHDQIGKPWAIDGNGPDAYSCWGLLRAWFRYEQRIWMPPIAVGDADSQVRPIKTAASVSGWKPVDGERASGDVVLMHTAIGPHCGLVLLANGHLGVFHSTHGQGVVFERWADAVIGARRIELWRKHAT